MKNLTGQSQNVYVQDPRQPFQEPSPYGIYGPQRPSHPGVNPPQPAQRPAISLPVERGSQFQINMLRSYLEQKRLEAMYMQQLQAWAQAHGIQLNLGK